MLVIIKKKKAFMQYNIQTVAKIMIIFFFKSSYKKVPRVLFMVRDVEIFENKSVSPTLDDKIQVFLVIQD